MLTGSFFGSMTDHVAPRKIAENSFEQGTVSAEGLIQNLEGLIQSHIAGGDPSDDITMLTALYTLAD